MTQRKNQSTSAFTTALLPTAKHWEIPAVQKLKTKAHVGGTQLSQDTDHVDPASGGMQLWALKEPDIEQQDSKTRCSGHWVHAEGNLKTYHSASLSCSFVQDHGSPSRQEACDKLGAG